MRQVRDDRERNELERRACKGGTTIADTQCYGGREIHDEVQPGQPNGQRAYGNGCERLASYTEVEQSERCKPEQSQNGTKEQMEFRRIGCGDDSRYSIQEWGHFPTQPPVCGRDDGLPFDVDHLTIPFTKWRTESIKAYGNAWVPEVAYEIFRNMGFSKKI